MPFPTFNVRTNCNWSGPWLMSEGSRDNSSYALEQLRVLVAGLPKEGERRLPTERALARQFGVSRRAVRRALEVLEGEDMVWRRQGSGTYAGSRPDRPDRLVGDIVSGTDFLELMEVRLRLEPQLAQLAAMRAGPEDVARMREIVARIYAGEEADERELWDSALHRAIARAAGNRLFVSLFDIVNRVRQDETWRAVRERARTIARSRDVTHSQHAAIVDAIAARHPARAGEAMREHLLLIQEILVRQTSFDHLAEPPAATADDPQLEVLEP